MKNVAALFLFLAIFFTSQSLEAREIPKLTGRVVDEAQMLTAEQKAALTQKLADYEKQTTNQIVVVTIPSLEGEVLEDYSMRIAEKWKIGQKGKDNGVILLVAKQDRKIRIEVGYGLEAVLTDGRCGWIIRKIIAPEFRQNNFYQGIDRAVDAMIKSIAGEKMPLPANFAEDAHRELPPYTLWVIGACFGVIIFLAVLCEIKNLSAKMILWLYAGMSGCVLLGWCFLLPAPPSIEDKLIMGVVLWIFALFVGLAVLGLLLAILGRMEFSDPTWASGSSSSYGGDYSGGGSSGFSNGRGGGFSGGGGSFGGGGASGGW